MDRIRQSSMAAGRGALAALGSLLVLAVGLALVAPAAAQEFPSLTGRVVDTADLLDPATEISLTEKLAAFEAQGSDQVVVVTVPDLQGAEIADYANRLGREWGIGQADENNGVVLLVSRDDREVRIEVGYGLEGTLTDALSSLIIQNDILPAFRGGDYPGGITRGVDGIIQVLSGDAAELQARAERNQDWSGEDFAGIAFTLMFAGVWIFVLGAFAMTGLARRFGKKLGRNRYRWLGIVWTLGKRAACRDRAAASVAGAAAFRRWRLFRRRRIVWRRRIVGELVTWQD